MTPSPLVKYRFWQVPVWLVAKHLPGWRLLVDCTAGRRALQPGHRPLNPCIKHFIMLCYQLRYTRPCMSPFTI